MCNKECGKTASDALYENQAKIWDAKAFYINSLATALDSLGNHRSIAIASTTKEYPVNKAIDDIAKELSKLTSQD
ncbi:hypothetical protein NVP1174O_20 [Vibrio phage 1.174.O._10N.261.55.A8]|nr:hypothetical protein NVP1174O_20 [Vibrio phage 1.174.O._10N.261.55.A8]